jgi:hypothetical protein
VYSQETLTTLERRVAEIDAGLAADPTVEPSLRTDVAQALAALQMALRNRGIGEWSLRRALSIAVLSPPTSAAQEMMLW